MNTETAVRIYKAARMLNLDDNIILAFEGFKFDDYKKAIKPYLESLPENEITIGLGDDEPYREYQESNFNEYFDSAHTYKYVYGYR